MKSKENNAIMSPRTRHTRFCHVFTTATQPRHRTLIASTTTATTMMLSTIVLYILSYCANGIVAFNLENRLPIVKYGDGDTYFGYSVAGHEIGDEDKPDTIKEKW